MWHHIRSSINERNIVLHLVFHSWAYLFLVRLIFLLCCGFHFLFPFFHKICFLVFLLVLCPATVCICHSDIVSHLSFFFCSVLVIGSVFILLGSVYHFQLLTFSLQCGDFFALLFQDHSLSFSNLHCFSFSKECCFNFRISWWQTTFQGVLCNIANLIAFNICWSSYLSFFQWQ